MRWNAPTKIAARHFYLLVPRSRVFDSIASAKHRGIPRVLRENVQTPIVSRSQVTGRLAEPLVDDENSVPPIPASRKPSKEVGFLIILRSWRKCALEQIQNVSANSCAGLSVFVPVVSAEATEFVSSTGSGDGTACGKVICLLQQGPHEVTGSLNPDKDGTRACRANPVRVHRTSGR